MKRGSFVLAAVLAALMGCGRNAEPESVTVLAASSLKRPLEKLAGEFGRANPPLKVQTSFAGSQDLVSQIQAGAPADVFASAGSASMNQLVGKGLADAAEVRAFASNLMVVAYRSDLSPPLSTLSDLGRPRLKLVIGEKRVPVGKMAHDLLDSAEMDETGIRERILKNVASYEQSDLALVAKVRLGEADAAIVYASDLKAEPKLKLLELPAALRLYQTYFVAPLKASKHPAAARRYRDELLGPSGEHRLKEFGFGPPLLLAEPSP